MSSSVVNEEVVKQIVALMEGKSEIYLFDPELAKKIQLSERSELAKLGFVIKHDGKTRLPNYIFRKDMVSGGGTATVSAVPVVKREKRKIEYIKPLFSDEVKSLLRCGKDWITAKSMNIRFVGPHGCGKCHTKGTLIKMYDGSVKKVEDILVGDLVMGNDSRAREVISLGNGVDDLYMINPKRGGKQFGVNSEHILRLWSHWNKKEINVTVREYLTWSKCKRNSHFLYRTTVEYKHRDVLIEPYFLGIWLGDGSSYYTSVTNIDKEVIDYIYGYSSRLGMQVSLDDCKDVCGYMITTGSRGGRQRKNPLLEKMRIYKICDGKKMIPLDYMINDRKTRLELLAGLIDSDGHNHGNCAEITQKRKNLAEQIFELAGSLGFGVSFKEKLVDGEKYYRCEIYGDLSVIPTRIIRKQFKTRRAGWKNPLRTGFNVNYLGKGEYFGFKIEGNHLYLLSDFTVTHNTEFVDVLAKECGFAKVCRINGHSEKSSADFLGEKTVVIDKSVNPPQSVVTYQKGVLELALTQGLKKDVNGNAEFDADGKVIVEGAPALLFIDEYAALSEHIGMLLNRVMEIPVTGSSRGIDLDLDGGRSVKGHPGFAIILAGNVLGKGCESAKTSGYTGQDNQMDDSTLDRVGATFEFGYNLDAERMYLEDALDTDDVVVARFIKFIEDVRKSKIDETVLTLLSTRGIVSICDLIKAYNSSKMKNVVVTAIYRSIYSGLREVERDAWAEKIRTYFDYDVRNLVKKDNTMFFV